MAGDLLSIGAWRAVITPLHILAILCTLFRVFHRYRKRKLWWDDYWAMSALFFDVIYLVMPWIRQGNPTIGPTGRKKQIAIFWLTSMLVPLIVWSARISIGMSIARLVPPKTRARWLLYGLNVTFFLMGCTLILLRVVLCTLNSSWHNSTAVRCYLGTKVAILNLSMDVAADTCLVAIPLQMLWRVKLPGKQRRLILLIFASSALSSIAGAVYATFVFQAQTYHPRWGFCIGFVSHVKAAVNLLVCNLLVIVTYLYCVFWRGEDDDDVTEPSETRSKPTVSLPKTATLNLTEISSMQLSQTPFSSYDSGKTSTLPISLNQ